MAILTINTAFLNAQIGVENNNQTYFAELDSTMKHSENLLPEIEKLLLKSNLTVNALTHVCVNVGPGSFTGLRISIATVKAFLMVNKNLNCLKVNTFELLAKNYFKESKQESATFVLDGLSGLYFICEINRKLEILSEPKIVEKADLQNFKNLVSNEVLQGVNTCVVAIENESLLKLAKEKIEKKEFISENELLPLYIRKSQAEENLNKIKK